MSFSNYAYFNTTTGMIDNIVRIEDNIVPTLQWPDGFSIVAIPDGLSGEHSMCGIGWLYLDGQFVEPQIIT